MSNDVLIICICEPTICGVCVCFHGILFTFVCYLCSYVVLFLLLALVIIIIIIIIIIISFMQGIYTYIPETNYVLREYCVAAIMLLLFMVLVLSVTVLNLLLHKYFPKYVCTAQYGCFLEFLDFMFSVMLLTYFLNAFEIVPVALIITGIIFVFTFHMRCISIVRSLYFRIFSASFLITFLSIIIIIIIIIIRVAEPVSLSLSLSHSFSFCSILDKLHTKQG